MFTNNDCYSSAAEHKHKWKKNKQLHVGKNGEGPRTGLQDMIIRFDIMYHVWVYSVCLDLLSVVYSNQTLNVNNKS